MSQRDIVDRLRNPMMFSAGSGTMMHEAFARADMRDAANRIEELESVLRKLPMYIDNWKWAKENIDILRTVPGMRFDNELEIKIGRLIPNGDGTLTDVYEAGL